MSGEQENKEVVYNKNRPLEKVFRNATARVLDFLLVNNRLDYSAAEISRITDIPLRTLHRVLPNLLENGLIKESRKVGNIRMFSANLENPFANAFKQCVSVAYNANIENVKKRRATTSSE